MESKLYKNEAQARRVTTIVQEALEETSRRHTLSMQPVQYVNGNVHIAPEVLAGTLSMWATQNVALNAHARALVEAPCRKHGIPIEVLGEYPLFTGTKLVRGASSDVVIVPATQDPLITTGKFPLPQHVRARLRALERAGVPFDLLYTYIAHEVPRNSVAPGAPIPLEVVAPPVSQSGVRLSESLGVAAHLSTISLLKGFRKASSAAIRTTAVGAIGTALATAILLDPLIFGAIADERGIATWFVLAQWAW
jgi:hypothetical protein